MVMLQQGGPACNGCLKPDGSPPRKSDRIIEARPHAEQPELLYILLTYFAFQCPYFSASSAFSHLLFSRSVVSNSLQPYGLQHTSLPFTVYQSLLKLVSTELVIPSNHFILSSPLLPSIFPSIRVFFNESALCIRWPNY